MRVFAITGGPGAGKSTLVAHLAALGHATVPEAAIVEIEALVLAHGLDGQRAWRSAHPLEFQRRVATRQLALEAEARARLPIALFCDRGLPDGLAYLAWRGQTPDDGLSALVTSGRYDGAFVLDTLDRYAERPETGRTSSRAQSLEIRAALVATYVALGIPVEVVPESSVDARAALVLARALSP